MPAMNNIDLEKGFCGELEKTTTATEKQVNKKGRFIAGFVAVSAIILVGTVIVVGAGETDASTRVFSPYLLAHHAKTLKTFSQNFSLWTGRSFGLQQKKCEAAAKERAERENQEQGVQEAHEAALGKLEAVQKELEEMLKGMIKRAEEIEFEHGWSTSGLREWKGTPEWKWNDGNSRVEGYSRVEWSDSRDDFIFHLATGEWMKQEIGGRLAAFKKYVDDRSARICAVRDAKPEVASWKAFCEGLPKWNDGCPVDSRDDFSFHLEKWNEWISSSTVSLSGMMDFNFLLGMMNQLRENKFEGTEWLVIDERKEEGDMINDIKGKKVYIGCLVADFMECEAQQEKEKINQMPKRTTERDHKGALLYTQKDKESCFVRRIP